MEGGMKNYQFSNLVTLTVCFFAIPNAFGEFHEDDANEVDKEYRDDEFLLDKKTYRYSLGLQDIWNSSENKNGYRTSFGSIDGNHFYRAEDLKMQVKKDAWQLEFNGMRREDFIERRFDSELKIAYFNSENFSPFASFSSNYFKKWADISGGIDLYSEGKKSFTLKVTIVRSTIPRNSTTKIVIEKDPLASLGKKPFIGA
jgi:hypothetical protein